MLNSYIYLYYSIDTVYYNEQQTLKTTLYINSINFVYTITIQLLLTYNHFGSSNDPALSFKNIHFK